jgi:hypothetical protein
MQRRVPELLVKVDGVAIDVPDQLADHRLALAGLEGHGDEPVTQAIQRETAVQLQRVAQAIPAQPQGVVSPSSWRISS